MSARRITDGLSAPADSIRPITPAQVVKEKSECIPPIIIDVFNKLITRKFTNGSARVTQDEAIQAITARMDVSRHQLFESGWLNIEEIYREQGWLVQYIRPDYTESFPAYFTFKEAT